MLTKHIAALDALIVFFLLIKILKMSPAHNTGFKHNFKSNEMDTTLYRKGTTLLKFSIIT